MIVKISSLADAMAALDKRLARLRISRSATKNFPGVKTETVNNWHAGRAVDMNFTMFLALMNGAGLEVYVRTMPLTSAEKRKYDKDLAAWMAEVGLALEPDSEVQVEQSFAKGVLPRRATRGIVVDPDEQ